MNAYSTAKLAARWSCSPQKIRNMIRAGDLACIDLGGMYRITAVEVERCELNCIGGRGTRSRRSGDQPAAGRSEQPTVLLRFAD